MNNPIDPPHPEALDPIIVSQTPDEIKVEVTFFRPKLGKPSGDVVEELIDSALGMLENYHAVQVDIFVNGDADNAKGVCAGGVCAGGRGADAERDFEERMG